MKLAKVITSSALSISLLATAIPAFAATSDASRAPEPSRICFKENFGSYTSRNSIPNVHKDDYGNKWYLKGATSWKGIWTGQYERCVDI